MSGVAEGDPIALIVLGPEREIGRKETIVDSLFHLRVNVVVILQVDGDVWVSSVILRGDK